MRLTVEKIKSTIKMNEDNKKVSKRIGDVSTLKSIISELGLQFEVISDSSEGTCYGTAYFIPENTCGELLYGTLSDRYQFDGLLIFRGIDLPISWTLSSPYSVKKWLTDPTDRQCSVCCQQAEYGCSMKCSGCGGRICGVCILKKCLTKESIMMIKCAFMTTVRTQCVQCKSGFLIDVGSWYFKILNHLNEFPKHQKETLLWLKEMNENHDNCMKGWKEYIAFNDITIVILNGLSQSEWNGKIAMITGKKVMKNDVVHWPVLIKDGIEKNSIIN
eukprot:50352_1